ncbi:lipopolysaccharide-induced tumor necrosis factor-alpha factor [Holotrichia oblita]|uniref:Lipopolysaccharide-induced tumor necrosis factor-alpha factor n=1 Tax=Holotrichia oblita TaxID=644536 RepID=A0ACB9TW46_HOLOL|nr:lipopolysaccharide-induced tumor necrosis factor-alpha factor [Holotrichia oblita]
MSKNDNQNSNNEFSDQENIYNENSKYSVNSKSEAPNTYSKPSVKITGNVTVRENENVSSVIEDVLQKCNEHIITNQNDVAGPSKKNNKDIAIIHPKQFDSITSSDHIFSETWLHQERILRTKNLTRPLSRMSDAAFKCLMLQTFPSAVDLRRKSSSTWHDLFHSKNVLCKSTNDNSTQFDLPSIDENAVSNSVFVRRAVTTTSQEIQITPSLVPPRPIHGSPPLEGAPPSYSAVMRIGDTAVARPFGRRVGSNIEPSPPFISPSPPPTYAETQGRFYRPILVDSELIWGPDPMATVCQRCGTHIITTITSQRSNLTHFAAVALCLCGCWPCCLLPYCMNSCKNTYHYCPNCSTYLGMYRPW